MPNNNKSITYVLGFENSDFLFADFQFHLCENAKSSYCSTRSYWKYNSLTEAKEALQLIKNKVKTILEFSFHQTDDFFSIYAIINGKTDDDFYIEPSDPEDVFLGCKYLKLPYSIDDLKIFCREVEVTYSEVTE